MGETIAKLMVAIFCVMFAASNASAQSSTQEPTTRLRLFKPQVGINGGSQGSGTRAGTGIPDFTGTAGRATARSGGPSTEQSPRSNSTRENVWAPNRPSGMQLPSTEPVLPGTIRTVSGTQDPKSAESQLLARQRDAELAKQRQERERLENERLAQERAKMLAAPTAPTGAASGTGQRAGFVNAPKDITLAAQEPGDRRYQWAGRDVRVGRTITRGRFRFGGRCSDDNNTQLADDAHNQRPNDSAAGHRIDATD